MPGVNFVILSVAKNLVFLNLIEFRLKNEILRSPWLPQDDKGIA